MASPLQRLRRRAAAVVVAMNWALGGLALIAAAAPVAAASTNALAIEQVAAGVYVHAGKVAPWPSADGDTSNAGFIVGERCVAVIDSGGSPAFGERLLAALHQVSPLPVCYLILTHIHPDHSLGASAFASLQPRPQVVAHAKAAAALGARERYYANAMQRDTGQALPHEQVIYPDKPIDGDAELDLGGRVLALRAWTTAHTDHDLTVLDRATGTLFAGDLLFMRHLPVLDGSLRGWLDQLALLRQLPAQRVVPGHGPASAAWPAALDPQQAYLRSVLDGTRAALRARRTIQQAVADVAADATAGWQEVETYHRRNLTSAYAELEWE